MRVLSRLEDFQPSSEPLILAIGNFDGVHLGHQRLLEKVKQNAQAAKGISSVLTFRQHPQAILHPSKTPPLLHSSLHKTWMLEEEGVDLCFMISFTKEFSELSAEKFVEEVLVKKLKVRKVFLGENARFGNGRKGDAALMKKLAGEFGFEFEAVQGVKVKNEIVSSSRIRKLIQEGNLEEAAECLGKPYRILAQVIHGDGRGASLGFPTANLRVDQEVMPPEGVYAVKLRTVTHSEAETGFKAGPWLSSVLNFGTRPTFHQEPGAPQVAEVFILDFKPASLYGQFVEVALYKKLREEKKFSDAEALKAQIQRDIERTKGFLT